MVLILADISKRLSLEVIDKIFKEKTNSADSAKTVVVSKVGAGEGMISAVYRINVTGSCHKTSFVAKGLVKDLLLRKSLRCCKDFFEREILFFSEILPRLKELQKSVGAKENIQRNIPVCYAYHVGDDEDYLVLEDLSETSCESVAYPKKANRDKTLEVLAHLHAVSIALRIHDPAVFSKLANKIKREVYFNEENREWFAKYMQNAIEIDKATLKEYESESSDYYKKFLDIINTDVYGQLIDLVSDSGDNPTMNHGDAWLPNFMFSNERTVAFDFQLFRCASLITDLSFYLALCSNLCSNKEDFYEAVDTYYRFLVYYLEDMGLNAKKVFSRKDLDEEMKRYGKFGLLASLTTIPLLASERMDVGQSLKDEYEGVDKIPLEDLWVLTPLRKTEHRMNLVNVIRVAVDVGLI